MLSLILFLHFTTLFVYSYSQNPADAAEGISSSRDPTSNFQPSLAIVVGMLSIVFSLTFIVLLYAKFCHRESSQSLRHAIQDGLLRPSRLPNLGLDKTVIESLPFFRFSSLKGSRRGLECAVCLSKFEDVEVLRLLPKCKHAFHTACIDQWLEKHSTCPLCRRSITPEDISLWPYSDSLRLLWLNRTDPREESNVELFVERVESHHGSTRFCIGSSFRKLFDSKNNNDNDNEELPICESTESTDDQTRNTLHNLNHKIIVSDVVFKSRWSSMSSSDIVFLNAEMLNQFSSSTASASTDEQNPREPLKGMKESDQIMSIKEEMERKRAFEAKIREINQNEDQTSFPYPCIPNDPNSLSESNNVAHTNKRSMSEIIAYPRFTALRSQDSTTVESDAKDERVRGLWLPIARKTIHWCETRERRHQQLQTLDV